MELFSSKFQGPFFKALRSENDEQLMEAAKSLECGLEVECAHCKACWQSSSAKRLHSIFRLWKCVYELSARFRKAMTQACTTDPVSLFSDTESIYVQVLNSFVAASGKDNGPGYFLGSRSAHSPRAHCHATV